MKASLQILLNSLLILALLGGALPARQGLFVPGEGAQAAASPSAPAADPYPAPGREAPPSLLPESSPAPVIEAQPEPKLVETPRPSLRAWASPALYLEGRPVRLEWQSENLSQNGAVTQLVVRLPEAAAPTDPALLSAKDGSLRLALERDSGSLELVIDPKAEFPLLFQFEAWDAKELDAYEAEIQATEMAEAISGLEAEESFGAAPIHLPIAQQSVQLTRPQVSLGAAEFAEKGLAEIGSLDGFASLSIPAQEKAREPVFALQPPGPQSLPPTSLSDAPLEILAVDAQSGENVTSFAPPLEVRLRYDP